MLPFFEFCLFHGKLHYMYLGSGKIWYYDDTNEIFHKHQKQKRNLSYFFERSFKLIFFRCFEIFEILIELSTVNNMIFSLTLKYPKIRHYQPCKSFFMRKSLLYPTRYSWYSRGWLMGCWCLQLLYTFPSVPSVRNN